MLGIGKRDKEKRHMTYLASLRNWMAVVWVILVETRNLRATSDGGKWESHNHPRTEITWYTIRKKKEIYSKSTKTHVSKIQIMHECYSYKNIGKI